MEDLSYDDIKKNFDEIKKITYDNIQNINNFTDKNFENIKKIIPELDDSIIEVIIQLCDLLKYNKISNLNDYIKKNRWTN